MARDSSGNYSLPSGNPVTTNTTIDSTVHNNTTSDIASEMTDSLSRSGKGGMLAVLKILDGSVSSPGAQFSNDANTGLYRVTTDTFGLSAGGTLVIKGEAATVTIPVKLVVESAESVDLTASTAGFAIGALSGQHIEFDDAEMQSKSDATTAATLSLNRLGGAVNIGAQSGTGAVTLYSSADACLITTEDGVQVKDGDGSVPKVDFATTAGTVVGRIQYNSGMFFHNLVNSGSITFQVKDSGGNTDTMLYMVADGGVTLYFAGAAALRTITSGVEVVSTSDDLPEVGFYQDDTSTRNARIQAHTSGLNIIQEVHGAPINLISENNAGTQKTVFTGDPDGAASVHYAGTAALTTRTTGIQLYSTSNDEPEVFFYQDDGSTRNAFILAGTSALSIANEVHGAPIQLLAEDTGGTQRSLIVADPDDATTLYYAGTSALATAAIASNGTGATVTDGGGTARPVGMNITPITSAAAGTDLRIANSGHLIRCTSAITVDIDTTTDTAPNGSFWTIENAAGANCTVSATGVNLVWLDGSAGTTGNRTLAAYGYVTVIKVSNGNYRIVGTGLS